jgi:hypothetical protein
MKFFKRIRADIPTQLFLEEIAGVVDAWAAATGRQEKIAVQREVLAIPLRGLRTSRIYRRKRRDVHESRWTPASVDYPLARLYHRCGGGTRR